MTAKTAARQGDAAGPELDSGSNLLCVGPGRQHRRCGTLAKHRLDLTPCSAMGAQLGLRTIYGSGRSNSVSTKSACLFFVAPAGRAASSVSLLLFPRHYLAAGRQPEAQRRTVAVTCFAGWRSGSRTWWG